MVHAWWLVACGAASVPVGANAEIFSQASAVLQSPTYTIYDATPGDGVAASAYFLDSAKAWRSSVGIGVTDYAGNDLGFDQQLGFSASGPAPQPPGVMSNIWPATGLGGAGGAWVAGTGEVKAQGQSLAAGIGYYADAELSTTSDASSSFYNLILGPGTGLVMTAEGTSEVWLSHEGDYAYASTLLIARFSPRAPDGSFQRPFMTTVYDRRTAWLDAASPELGGLPPGAGLAYQRAQGVMQVTYENLSDAEQIGRVRFLALADGLSMPAANVPEPQSAWMLLAGLTGLAFVRKRLRQSTDR